MNTQSRNRKPRKRIRYSQNFLKDKGLVKKLIEKTSLTPGDLVIEIGAGKGLITQGLSDFGCKVVAYEIDGYFYDYLVGNFSNLPNVTLHKSDFTKASLPNGNYKIFSNIPFNLTSKIIHKTIQAHNPPANSFLIVQKEAAYKFTGLPIGAKESLASLHIKPWFAIKIIHSFKRSDYHPQPKVDTVLLGITKRDTPKVSSKMRTKYLDFTAFAFSRWQPTIKDALSGLVSGNQIKKIGINPKAKPSQVDFEDWLKVFDFFIKNTPSEKNGLIKSAYKNLKEQQSGLKKIHRTRTDRKWKKYKQS